jgi:site-specific DNA-cytosine methylase
MGGVSDGFAKEGFEVTGIDIVNAPEKLGYKHKFIQADIKTLDGKDFQGHDVIWGSPPCRDFSVIGVMYGHTWKRPPDPDFGLSVVNAFLKLVKEAKPKFWIMENVARATKFIPQKPIFLTNLHKGKKHAFWGDFPASLIPKTNETFYTGKTKSGKCHSKYHNDHALRSWKIAKLPEVCTRSFARACKNALTVQNEREKVET